MSRKARKISESRQAKLDRIHLRDCPGARNIEFSCLRCSEILDRKASDQRRRA